MPKDTQDQVGAEEVQPEKETESDEAVSDEQATEAVGELIQSANTQAEEESEAQETEVQAEEQAEAQVPEQTESQTEEPEEQVTIPIIDDEMIKKNPVLRSYYGKPVTALGDAYQSLVSKYTKDSQTLKELEKKLAVLSRPKEDDLSDMPDPQDEPEKYKQWLKDRDKRNQDYGKQEAQKEPEPQVDVVAGLAQFLPKDTDVNAVIESWANNNAYRLYDQMGNLKPEMASLYNKDPNIFYQEVTEYYNRAVKDSKTTEEVKKEGHKKLQKDFKKARASKKNMPKANVQAVPRGTELSQEEEMLLRIGELALEDEN
jgi:hypothetical protein